jgi:hypothetical protein
MWRDARLHASKEINRTASVCSETVASEWVIVRILTANVTPVPFRREIDVFINISTKFGTKIYIEENHVRLQKLLIAVGQMVQVFFCDMKPYSLVHMHWLFKTNWMFYCHSYTINIEAQGTYKTSVSLIQETILCCRSQRPLWNVPHPLVTCFLVTPRTPLQHPVLKNPQSVFISNLR